MSACTPAPGEEQYGSVTNFGAYLGGGIAHFTSAETVA